MVKGINALEGIDFFVLNGSVKFPDKEDSDVIAWHNVACPIIVVSALLIKCTDTEAKTAGRPLLLFSQV